MLDYSIKCQAKPRNSNNSIRVFEKVNAINEFDAIIELYRKFDSVENVYINGEFFC